MKKNLIKIFSVIMAIVMALSAGTVAFADMDDSSDTETVYRYSTIGSTSTSFNISGITATCTAKLSSQYSTSLKITMDLQKKSSGTYSTVKTWTATRTGTLLNISKTKTINPLSTYRLKVTFKAGNETFVTYKY